MTITIMALGSHGDVLPPVALGVGLQQAGYTVRVATMANFGPMAREAGLDFHPIKGDARVLVGQLMPEGSDNLSLLAMFQGLRRSFLKAAKDFAEGFAAPALRDSTAVLSQLPGGVYSYDLAERLDVPHISLSVIPQEATAAWPMPLFPSRLSLGGAYNRLTYKLGQQILWHLYRSSINDFRQRLGLGRASFWWGNMRKMAHEQRPVLQGFSEHVVPTAPEWGAHIHTTGYWDMDEADWQPPADLVAFLEAGPPPVFVGFGSMNVGDVTGMIVEGLAGYRGVISAGWAELGSGDLPDTIYPLDYAPYKWLFPRMSALVHHGGSGTTGLALRSGTPSMVVPFIADQPFWGERIHALGAGPPPVPFKELTAEALAAAIDTMLHDETMHHRAAALRDAMADEDGVSKAVALIARLLK